MLSTRNKLHLQAGTDDILDVVATETGASITYEGANAMTFTAAAFKFRQQGQDEDTNLFEKIEAVETTVSQNLGLNNAAITDINSNINTVTSNLEDAEEDLVLKNTAAIAKFDANQQRIEDEVANRQTAIENLDSKFSLENDGGQLHTLNAEILVEKARITQETKESDTESDRGTRQQKIIEAKTIAEAAIRVQQVRVDEVALQLTNLFAGFPAGRAKNLADLITAYEAADSSLTDTLSQSMSTLAQLKAIIDTTFPPQP